MGDVERDLGGLGAGASLRDRAGGPADLSHSTVSQPEALIPSADDWLLSELTTGIANLKKAILETERSDTFWRRYWDGYLKGYESLLAMALARASGLEERSDGAAA